jgi:hypothetical protein
LNHTPELKPCPFCNGPAELDTQQGYISLEDGVLRRQAAVYCNECSAHITLCYRDAPGMMRHDVVRVVVDCWNMRAADRGIRAAAHISERYGSNDAAHDIRALATVSGPPADSREIPEAEIDRQARRTE